MNSEPPALTPDSPAASETKTSASSIWSLVLGILSIILCLTFLAGIPAVILGIVSLKKVAADGNLKGKGMAITGISTGAIGTLVAPVILAIMIPALAAYQNRAHQELQVVELKRLGMACQSYAIANRELFPENLGQLFPGYLDDETLLTWEDPKTGQSKPYLYRPGHSPGSATKEPILLAPEELNGEWAVAYNNGIVETIPRSAAGPILHLFGKAPGGSPSP